MPKRIMAAAVAFASALGVTVSALAAPTPTVWWNGDFTTTEKTGTDGVKYTLAETNGVYTVTPESAGATNTAVSVVVKYSGLKAITDAAPTLIGFNLYQNSNNSQGYVEFGIRASTTNSTTIAGWYGTSTYAPSPTVTAPEDGYVMVSFLGSSGTGIYAGESLDSLAGGVNTSLKFANTTVTNITVGGPYASTAYPAWDDVEIKSIAVFLGSSVVSTNDVADFEFDASELYGWEFNTNGTFSTLEGDVGGISLSKDGNNFSVTNGVLDLSGTPYVASGTTINYSNPFTYVIPGVLPSTTNTIYLGIGHNGTGAYVLATGENAATITLMEQNTSGASSAITGEYAVESPKSEHLFVLEADGAVLTAYVDGKVALAYTNTTDITTSNPRFQLGSVHGGAGTGVQKATSGKIDAIRIYDGPLSSSQMAALVSEFPFDSGVTITIPGVENMIVSVRDGDGDVVTITAADDGTMTVTVEQGSKLEVTYTPNTGYVGNATTITIDEVEETTTIDASTVIVPTAGVATVTSGETVIYYTSLSDAVNAATNDGEVVTLVANWSGYLSSGATVNSLVLLTNATWTITDGYSGDAGAYTIKKLSGSGSIANTWINSKSSVCQQIEINDVTEFTGKVTGHTEYVTLPSGYDFDDEGYVIESTGVVATVGEKEFTKIEDAIAEALESNEAITIVTNYTATSDQAAAFKTNALTVKLTGNATINMGSFGDSEYMMSTFDFVSGTNDFTFIGTKEHVQFGNAATADKPTLLVEKDAVLNFTARDVTGWNNDASTRITNAVIRVNDGGTLSLKQYGSSTFYYQGLFYFEPGAKVTTAYADKSFRLNGGTEETYAEMVVPDSESGSDPVVISGTQNIRFANNSTIGYAIKVGENSTLKIEPELNSENSNDSLYKYGNGTLVLEGAMTNMTATTKVCAGTLELERGKALGGALVVDEGAVLNIAGTETLSEGLLLLGTTNVTLNGTLAYNGAALPADSKLELTSEGLVYSLYTLKVGDEYFDSLIDAIRAAGSGGTITILKDEDSLKAEAESMGVTLTAVEGEEGAYTLALELAATAALRFSEIMPKPSDKPYEITTQSGYDKHGLESGWVELENTSDSWVDLKDYKFCRANRGKVYTHADYGNFPSVLIAPKSRFTFYTSERYANSASLSESAFAEAPEGQTKAGAPYWYGDMLIWGDKVNPKKFPYVTLVYRPDDAAADTILETVIIPSDTPEGYSIIVGHDESDTEATKRWLCPSPTFNAENTATDDLVKIGPNLGGCYGAKKTVSEFGAIAPAKPGEDYAVSLNVNPVYNAAGTRAADMITGVTLVYRTCLTNATAEVAMTKAETGDDGGDVWTAAIPHAAFDDIGAGELIQWKTKITDAAGNVWISPSFMNKDDGYEWLGTITEPDADQMAENLATWHMFVDADSKAQMDVDADAQTLENNARVAIYDSSTSNYYDYVRIDLRGNTSAHFNKKSHGLRFSKVHPLTMYDPVRGTTWKEIRKTSLIGEPGDPSRLRQLTAFWLWNEMGNKVPFDFPVRCNLNGEFFQVGFNSERFTDELIEDVYGLDKYGYGFKNVGRLNKGLTTSAGSIDKKTPDDGNETDLTVLKNELATPMYDCGVENGVTNNAALTKFAVEKFDLPAWFNYLASARITQEMDDVWANISAYYDDAQMLEGSRGTGTWMPLGYDFNLTFGQWYYNDVTSIQRPLLMSNQDWFKSHPFYGGNGVRCYKGENSTTAADGWNRGIETVLQNEKFRRLYLRRLRTLMDAELGEPVDGETFETTTNPIIVKMKEVAALMGADGDLDRTTYPWDSSINNIDDWGSAYFPSNITAGIEEIYTDYIVPRREHLYVTHSVTNTAKEIGYGTAYNAGIPEAQSAIADLKAGFSAEAAADGASVTIKNANAETVDMSGWVLAGPVNMTLPAGTVIDQGTEEAPGELIVVLDRKSYIAANDDALTDEVIVGNASAGESETITLTAGDEKVIGPTEASDQAKYLRLYGFCGVPDALATDAGEFIIFTNINQEASLDASGAEIQFEKTAESKNRCHFTLPEGTIIPAGGWVRFEQANVPWEKITNGKLDIVLKDSDGNVIYSVVSLSQDDIGTSTGGTWSLHDIEADTWSAVAITDAPGYVEPEPEEPVESEILTGEYTNAVTSTAAEVVVSNANITAGLTLSGAATLTLVGENTANSITAGGMLTLAGDGSLTMEGTGTLMTLKDGLTVNGGTLDLAATLDTGKGLNMVQMTGDYIQTAGVVNAKVVGSNQATKDKGAYAFRWDDTEGIVSISGGTFNADITSDNKGAAFKLSLVTNSVGAVTSTVAFEGGTINGTLAGVKTKVVDTPSAITMKSKSQVTINSTATDGSAIKSDSTIEIKSATISITCSGEGQEGIEAGDTITINNKNAKLTLNCVDDCINAASNIVVTLCDTILAKSSANDAFDSNGDMTIAGGTLVLVGLGEGHEGIDVDPEATETADGLEHHVYVTGGTVLSIGGTDSKVHLPEADGQAYAVWTNDVQDVAGKVLATIASNELSKVVTYFAIPSAAGSVFLSSADAATVAAGPDAIPDDAKAVVTDYIATVTVNYTFQENLRVYEVYGSTADGADGDTGEYIVLTNISDKAINLSGVKIKSYNRKKDKYTLENAVLGVGSLGSLGSIRVEQSDYWPTEKISNGKIRVELYDSDGNTIQTAEAEFSGESDGGGASLIATSFESTVTAADWVNSFYNADSTPEIKAASAEEAAALVVINTPGETTAEVYRALFDVTATETAETGVYSVSIALKSEVVEDVKPKLDTAALAIDAAGIADGAEDSDSVAVETRAGLFYRVDSATDLAADATWTAGTPVMGDGTKLTLKIVKPTDAPKAFFKVVASPVK